FCSQETLRLLAPQLADVPDMATCLVARCHDPQDVDRVAARLRRDYPDMGVYASGELSLQAKLYWLFRSRSGMVMIGTLVLALLVGLTVTSEELYAAVLAQAKEFAVLDALGFNRRRVKGLVLAQAFWLGLGGSVLALPCIVALARAALVVHTQIVVSAPILAVTFALTLGMAALAGLSALRPL